MEIDWKEAGRKNEFWSKVKVSCRIKLYQRGPLSEFFKLKERLFRAASPFYSPPTIFHTVSARWSIQPPHCYLYIGGNQRETILDPLFDLGDVRIFSLASSMLWSMDFVYRFV